MEQLFKFLPIIAQLLASPEVARLLPLVLKNAGSLFPNVAEADRPAAAVSVLDVNGTKWTQTALRLLGADIQADGSYGTATKNAVTKFQRDHGLEADGWAGDLTQEALRLAVLKGAG